MFGACLSFGSVAVLANGSALRRKNPGSDPEWKRCSGILLKAAIHNPTVALEGYSCFDINMLTLNFRNPGGWVK